MAAKSTTPKQATAPRLTKRRQAQRSFVMPYNATSASTSADKNIPVPRSTVTPPEKNLPLRRKAYWNA